MSTLLRLISCVAVVGLLGSSLYADTIVFSDDFESGNLGQWTQGASPLTISTEQNRIPGSGLYSAKLSSSANRMYRNLGSEVTGQILFTSNIYDDMLTPSLRPFVQMHGYAGAGYNDGAVQQLVAIGRYSSVTMGGETYDATKYQGRVLYPAAPTLGWFNLNASGAPSRSLGWHRFDIEVMPGGTTINFYVDQILSRAITGATAVTYDSIAVGLNAGTSAGNAWVDGVSVSIVPEPGSIALVASGLLALVGLALARRRRLA